MSIWWCNQSNSWEDEYPRDLVCASDQVDNVTYRKTVGDVVRGDLIVHYRKPRVVAISRALENGSYHRTLPDLGNSSYGSGWRFRTQFHELRVPVHRKSVPVHRAI
jgi:hypothetical protein